MSRCSTLVLVLALMTCGCEDASAFVPCGAGWTPEQMPLFVAHDPTARAFAKHIFAAVDIWNDGVGMWLMLPADELDSEDATGSIVSVIGVDGDRGEAEIQLRGCKVLRAEVRIPFDSPRPARRIAHELGHVLRLVHDAEFESVMHPNSAIGGERVEPDDAAALRAAYGPQH